MSYDNKHSLLFDNNLFYCIPQIDFIIMKQKVLHEEFVIIWQQGHKVCVQMLIPSPRAGLSRLVYFVPIFKLLQV